MTLTHVRAQNEVPNAVAQGSTFDEFVEQLNTVRSSLPVIESEIGDTWIYGGKAYHQHHHQTHRFLTPNFDTASVVVLCAVASDPLKLAQFREVLRVRRACLDARSCSFSDAAFREFDRLLTKVGEHTWGVDVKVQLSIESFELTMADGSY